MKRALLSKILQTTIAALLFCLALPGAAMAVTYNLRAEATTINLPGVGPVPMWGYALDGGAVQIPGPVLEVPIGDTLEIVLTNNLPVATSIVIPGQVSSDTLPAPLDETQRLERMRSFVMEVPSGATMSYTWTNFRDGTFLYQSGTTPSVQVGMGLYGAAITDTLGTPLVFSEVDVAMHQAVDNGTYGTAAYPTVMAVGYSPSHFLINGQPHMAGSSAIQVTNPALLQLLNAGLRTRVVTVPDVPSLTLLAEDGYPYTHPRTQTTVELPAGKTMDVELTAPTDGYLTLFDRALGLANGGMLTHLTAGTPSVTLNVVTDANGSVMTASLPGGIDSGGMVCPTTPATDDEILRCTENMIPNTEVTLKAMASPGFGLLNDPGPPLVTAWLVTDAGVDTGECPGSGDCVVLMNADKTVTATFTAIGVVKILAPQAGATLSLGSTYTVRWSAPANAVFFDVAYKLGTGTPWVLIAKGTSDYQALWEVPTLFQQKGPIAVSVVGYDSTGAVVGSDEVGFNPLAATITLTDSLTLNLTNDLGEPIPDPITPVPINTGDTIHIVWSDRIATTPIARYGLWYQLAPGERWIPIDSVNPDTAGLPPVIYPWIVPDIPADSLSVRVGIIAYDAAGNPIMTDTSDTFSIVVPAVAAAVAPAGVRTASVNLSPSGAPVSALGMTDVANAAEGDNPYVMLSPNGGEFIPADTPFTVLWQAPEEAASFTLSYSLDEGKSWKNLAEELTDTQFDWVIDTELGGNGAVLLKVTGFDEEGKKRGEDTTDEAFALE